MTGTMAQLLFVRLCVVVTFSVVERVALVRLVLQVLRLDLSCPTKMETFRHRWTRVSLLVCFASTPRMQYRREMLKRTPLVGAPKMWRSVTSSLIMFRPGVRRLFACESAPISIPWTLLVRVGSRLGVRVPMLLGERTLVSRGGRLNEGELTATLGATFSRSREGGGRSTRSP